MAILIWCYKDKLFGRRLCVQTITIQTQMLNNYFPSSHIAIYFSEIGNICPVGVWNHEIWHRHKYEIE